MSIRGMIGRFRTGRRGRHSDQRCPRRGRGQRALRLRTLEDRLLLSANIVQVSDNDYPESGLEVSGSHVVWYGADSGGYDAEIFLYDDTTKTTTQVTDNSHGDYSPQVSGSHVAWYGADGSGGEIFLYDITTKTTTQVTDNEVEEWMFQLSDSLV